MGIFQSVIAEKSGRAWGWNPDIPDIRDKKVNFERHHYNQIKTKVDLRDKFKKIHDQKNLGSCCASAVISALTFDQQKQNLPHFDPSLLFLYYNERESTGLTQIDCGSSIRSTIKTLNKVGLCEEGKWPYNVDYYSNKPTSTCYKDSKFQGCLRYKRLKRDLGQLQTCLSMGRPFVFGFGVYDSFLDPTMWNPKTDDMPIPNPNKEKLLGGHCVIAVGYSDRRKSFLVQNSWSREWGMNGCFLIPYKFITSEQCKDFWVIESCASDEKIIDDKMNVERDSYVDVVRKQKRSKKKKRRKRKYHDDDESDSSIRMDDEEAVKVVKVEIPSRKSSKCLIRDN